MRTPVLLIAFNRPETTQRVVERLIEVGAANVYIFIDGPRFSSEADEENVAKVREIIQSSKWPKEPRSEFLKGNLGCRKGVAHAINWFFENETEGIILEDDCLPDLTFFDFCSELLESYREDPRVGAICGTTHFALSSESPESYRFTRYPHQWGWATWRRAWAAYDSDLDTWHPESALSVLRKVSGGSRLFPIFWRNLLEKTKANQIDTWDYIWFYSFWNAGFLAISPRVNLVRNIGFGRSATHTKTPPLGESFHPKSLALNRPFEPPALVEPDMKLEARTRWLVMGVGGKTLRSLARLIYLINQSLRRERVWCRFR